MALGLTILFMVHSALAEAPDDPGEFQGITYLISPSRVAVEQPVNGSSYNLSVYVKVNNLTLTDRSEGPVNMTVRDSFWRGIHTYDLTFERNLSGVLRFEVPVHEQRFITPVKTAGPVKVVLPPGYSTGDRLLGISSPDPDVVEANGTVLLWKPSAEERIIEVSYYKSNAPRNLRMAFLFISLLGVALGIYYYLNLRRLRSFQADDWHQP
ncbi:MAG: hypothetical protein GKC10_07335 [Methanosarcinales archaeon]|nr:hypothetical protein [Methanosarcinales archaeon]